MAKRTRYETGMRDQIFHTRAFLTMRISNGEKNLTIKLTRFLDTNRRVDRDAVIKKSEELRTLKELLKHDIFQSNL